MYQKAKNTIKRFIPRSLFAAFVNKYHWLEAFVANVITGFPAKGMKVIGVTGTSGKSTTTALISHIFNENGKKTAHFTTTNAFWGGEEHENASSLTTETPLNLYKRIKKVKESGDEYLTVETSAHAIVQNRLAFVSYRGGVFTNLSHDHLDYFGDMQTYAAVKQRLFIHVAEQGGYGVFEAQDEYTPVMEEPIEPSQRILFGLQSGDVAGYELSEKDGMSYFTAIHGEQKVKVAMPLIGRHNVKNALAAIACAVKEGVDFERAAKSLSSFTGVKGRMERFTAPNGAQVLIDFAHTPDAFELILSGLRNSTDGKLLAVFGGYGDRDPSIRGPFGRITATYCDDIILTEDTVGSETVEAINRDILNGIEKVDNYKGKVTQIEAREDAILEALSRAGPDDTVALLGKGHEREIKRYPKNKPWDEIAATKHAFDLIKEDQHGKK